VNRELSKSRGMSLYVVFSIMAVLIIICTAMTGVGLMNLNITQSFYNGAIAQSEAEAAVSILLYNVSDNIDYGLHNEKITGTITDGFDSRECYHVITFDKTQGFPWSVNAKDDPQTGYRNRTVPKSMVSAFATGYCRGQFRTIEVLLFRPPFPYAIASSGRIHSEDHILVDGVESAAEAESEKHKRPGHIYSSYMRTGSGKPNPDNPSDYAVYIGDKGGDKTYISGFVLSPGNVLLKPPATVKEGIRAEGDKVEIPNIDVKKYHNEGDEGVIKIVSSEFGGPQNLDAMYFHSGNLNFASNVKMSNAFLYLKDGTLDIGGGLTGCGAIVVKNGAVNIKGDAALNGNNRIAIICDGPVTLEGNNNYFQGLIYSHGNVSARNITVVGNLIMDGRDSSGNADATREVKVSNFKALSNSSETATIAFTAHSSTDAETAYYDKDSTNRLPCIGFSGGSVGLNQGQQWWVKDCFDKNGQGGIHWIEKQLIGDDPNNPAVSSILFSGKYGNCDPDLKGMLDKMSELAKEYQDKAEELKATPKTITEHHDTPPPGHDVTVPNPAYIALENEMKELRAEYEKTVKDFAACCYEVYKQNTNNGCTYDTGGKTINVSKPFKFDVNEFLITGSSLKVMYWHIYNARI